MNSLCKHEPLSPAVREPKEKRKHAPTPSSKSGIWMQFPEKNLHLNH